MPRNPYLPGDTLPSLRWNLVCFGVFGLILGGWTTLHAADEPLVRVQYNAPVPSGSPADSPPAIEQKTVEGRVRIQAVDGGLLIEDRQGGLWPITASQSPETETIAPQYTPLNADELATALKAELGEGFEVFPTTHYLVCTNAGRGYGEWCGRLFERLHAGFQRFWKRRIPDLKPPEQPLVAIAFATQKEFQAYQLSDAGGQAGAAQGYFSARSNRMVLFNQSGESRPGRALTAAQVQKLALQNPMAIATVIHEAVHQLSFNIGLQTRYADNPAWFSEGLAMYFETPDLEAQAGWRTIGKLNTSRLVQYRNLASVRPLEIRSLIATDDRFRDPTTAIDAYAEAWALHYYLVETQKDKYDNYLKGLGAKQPLKWDTPDQRVAEFEAAFGATTEVERALTKYMARRNP